MANPHSREFPTRQHKPLVIPSFPGDIDSRAASALAPPWPLSAADFMDVQLLELTQLNDRLNRLNQQFNPFIETCLAGRVPVDVFTAICLVRLRGEVHELTGHAEQVVTSNYQRRIQVNARR